MGFSPNTLTLVTYSVLLEFVTDGVQQARLDVGFVDEQRLHGVTGGRIVTLGVNHCSEKRLSKMK